MKILDRETVRRELFPRVSAAFLSRHGLLSDDTSLVKGFISRGVPFIVGKKDRLSIEIITNDYYGPVVQRLHADYFVAGAFDKPFFLCPILLRRCKEVLLVNGIWASRAGHELKTRNGLPIDHHRRKLVRQRDELLDTYFRPWARSQKKQDLLHAVRRYLAEGRLLPDAWGPLEPVTERAAEERRAQTRNRLRSTQADGVSVEAAIKRGTSAGGSVELGIHLTLPVGTV